MSNETEIKDQRESAFEEQISLVNQRKNQNISSREYHATIQEQKHTQQMREVKAMKEINAQEVVIVRNFLNMRKELIHDCKQTFQLSDSSSTLIQQPPELLAAMAISTHGKEEEEEEKEESNKKQLKQLEKRFLMHTRSNQIKNYVLQKDQAKKHRVFPPVPVLLNQLSSTSLLPEEITKKFEEKEMFNHLISQLMEQNIIEDMSTLIPPSNSPPNAMRFYGKNRPAFLPPFASSTERSERICQSPFS
jgi:hypothetical protein